MESACKPGSVEDNHSSRTHVTVRLKRPTRTQRGPRIGVPIWSCSGWGLPCRPRYRERGALLPHLFTLTANRLKTDPRRYVFCGTFRRLTPPRGYLAPCPVEPGLSSALLRHKPCAVCSRFQDRGCPADSRRQLKPTTRNVQVAIRKGYGLFRIAAICACKNRSFFHRSAALQCHSLYAAVTLQPAAQPTTSHQ